MKEYKGLLDQLVNGKLSCVSELDENSKITSFKELLDARYVTAIDASSCDGFEYIEPKITLAGRQYLTTISRKKKVWYSPLLKLSKMIRLCIIFAITTLMAFISFWADVVTIIGPN